MSQQKSIQLGQLQDFSATHLGHYETFLYVLVGWTIWDFVPEQEQTFLLSKMANGLCVRLPMSRRAAGCPDRCKLVTVGRLLWANVSSRRFAPGFSLLLPPSDIYQAIWDISTEVLGHTVPVFWDILGHFTVSRCS